MDAQLVLLNTIASPVPQLWCQAHRDKSAHGVQLSDSGCRFARSFCIRLQMEKRLRVFRIAEQSTFSQNAGVFHAWSVHFAALDVGMNSKDGTGECW